MAEVLNTSTAVPRQREAVEDDGDALLIVDNLSVRYGADTPHPFTAVADVSLRIERGERIALVGESGSGKTTLGLAIGGFLTQQGVDVSATRFDFEGRALKRSHVSRMPARTPGMSMVFQDAMTSLDPVWTIGSQLKAVLNSSEKLNRKETQDKSRSWLARVGLPDTNRVMKARPYELSGGMRQRVMVALALAGNPRLLIADEPTSALDASLSREAMELLVELTDDFGASLLIISHDIHLCQEFADRMMVMLAGSVVEQGMSATLARTATHPYTVGLLRCVPTLASASLDELPTLASVAAEMAGSRRMTDTIETVSSPTEASTLDRDTYCLLSVESVTKRFGGKHGKITAVDDVTLAFDTNKMIGIVGESGSGKSTLARMMVGLETPTAGAITLNGRSITDLLDINADRLEARRTLQFVGQDTTSSFDPRRTLRDAVRLPAMVLNGLSKSAADERVDETLELLGLLPAMANRMPTEVSGGQRQRFSLARGLVVGPRLLVCDEVVSALDVSVQGSILNLLKKYCREKSAGLAFVSHGLPATAFISDELVVMLRGQIVEQGPTLEIIAHPQHDYTKKLLDAYRGAESAA